MSADDFIALLNELLAPVQIDRTIFVAFEKGFVEGPRNGSVYVTFINLPSARVKERRGGRAEAENNRMLFSVDGFSTTPSVEASKVVVESQVNNVIERERRLRKKTASPQKIAEYLAKHIVEVASSTPPRYTHE